MPTGYTHNVTETTTLEQFIWTCARAYGALITMRDDPMDVPIPQKLEPSDYHQKALAKAEDRVREVAGWSDADALADQSEQREKDRASYARMNGESVTRGNAYNRLLALVMDWTPPTSEHTDLKNFMVEQLTRSRDFDCHEYTSSFPPEMSAGAWKARAMALAEKDVAYHRENWQEEQIRVDGRNAWIQALRDSLQPAAVGR